MNYFYACLPDNNHGDELFNSINIPADQVYVDTDGDEGNWHTMIQKLEEQDTLVIPAFEYLFSPYSSIKDRLYSLLKLHVYLKIDDKEVEVSLLISFMDYLEDNKRKKAKELQRKGIEKALKKKYNGEGRFGRPKIEKPEDFGENILRIMRKELSHDTYRAQLGMKRSTYYKLVKEEKESWTKSK